MEFILWIIGLSIVVVVGMVVWFIVSMIIVTQKSKKIEQEKLSKMTLEEQKAYKEEQRRINEIEMAKVQAEFEMHEQQLAQKKIAKQEQQLAENGIQTKMNCPKCDGLNVQSFGQTRQVKGGDLMKQGAKTAASVAAFGVFAAGSAVKSAKMVANNGVVHEMFCRDCGEKFKVKA